MTEASSSEQTDAAAIYSGITWSVNTIENLALQVYWKNPDSWPRVLDSLKRAVDGLREIEASGRNVSCPWPSCDDGSCMPICKDR